MPSLGLIIRAAPWAIAAIAVAAALWYRSDYYAEVAARAEDGRAAEKAAREAVIKYNERELAKTAEIEARHKDALDAVRREAKGREDAIIRIKVSGARDCAPFDALFDSLSRSGGQAGGGSAAPAVRKPN